MRLKNSNKKAQIAIFVIIAIVLATILILVFLPKIQEAIAPTSPSVGIQDCLTDKVELLLPVMMAQGGSLEPTAYLMYNDEKVEYLCYNSEWYQSCVMQKPLLLQSIEKELTSTVEEEVFQCLDDAKESLRRKGYTITETGTGKINVNIVPDNVLVVLDSDIIVTKGEAQESISIANNAEFDSNAYEMIMIATSILNYESRYGDAIPENYMAFYSNIKVEQLKQSEGSTIYIITDRNTNEELKFASRSFAWPPGMYYGS